MFSRYSVFQGKLDETDLADDEDTCALVVSAIVCALEIEERVIGDVHQVQKEASWHDYELFHRT